MNGARPKMEGPGRPPEEGEEEETSFSEYAKGSDYQPSYVFQMKFSIRSTLNEGQLGGKLLRLQQFLNKNQCEAVKVNLQQNATLRSLDLKVVSMKTKELILSFNVHDEEERKLLERGQDGLADILQRLSQTFSETKDCDMKFYCKTDFADTGDPAFETAHRSPGGVRKRRAFDLRVQVLFNHNTSTRLARREVSDFIHSEVKKLRLIHVLREKAKVNVSTILGREPRAATEDFGFDIVVTVNDISEYDAVKEMDIHECVSSFFESSKLDLQNNFSVNIINASECQRHFGQRTTSRAQVMVKRHQSIPDFVSDEDRTLSFCLFIPYHISKTTLSVSVVMKSRPGKFMKQELRKEEITSPHQKPNIVTLWTGDLYPDEQYMNFMYRRKSSVDGSEPTDTIERSVTAKHKIRRDIWGSNCHNDESRSAHVLHIMQNMNESSIHDKMKEISEFTRTSGAVKLTDTIKSYHLSHQFQPIFQMFYLFFLSISKANVTSDLDRTQAQQIIIYCEKCDGSFLPKEDMDKVCDTVFKLGKRAEFSWANLIMYTYNFLETETNLQLFDKYKGTDINFKGQTYGFDEPDLERRKKAILSLMRRACRSGTRDNDAELIQRLFKVDLDWAFKVYGEIIDNDELKNVEGFVHLNRILRTFFDRCVEEDTKLAEKKKNLSNMPKVWKFIKAAKLNDYEGHVANIVFKTISTASKPGHGSEDQCLDNAKAVEKLAALGAFNDADKQKELLRSSIRTYSYYRLFPRLIYVLGECIVISKSDLLNVIMQYLDFSLGKSETSLEDRHSLKGVLDDFEAIYDIRNSSMDKCRETIYEQFENTLSCIQPDVIVKTIGTIDSWKHSTAKLFYKFAIKLIENDPAPYRREAEKFCASNSVLGHKNQAACVRIIAESFSLSEQIEECLFVMLEKPQFWTGILNVSGKHAEVIKSSSSYKVALSTLTKLSKCFGECDVQNTFLEQMATKKEELKTIYINSDIPKQKLVDSLTDCLEKRKRCCQVSDCCIRLFTEIRDRYIRAGEQSLGSIMDNCRSHFDCTKDDFFANKTSLLSYWNEITELLNSKDCTFPVQWTTLSEIIDSQVFWNIELRELESKKAEQATLESKNTVHSAISLVSYLSIAGVRNFKRFWGNENATLGEGCRIFYEVVDINEEERKAKVLMKFDIPPLFPLDKMRMVVDIPEKQNFLLETEEVWKLLLPKERDDTFTSAMSFLHKIIQQDSEIYKSELREVGEHLEYLFKLPNVFDETYEDILGELAQAEGLITFLQPILNEDITYLVDAVEEFVEQLVPEHAVSALISTKEFIQQLLSKKRHTVVEFLEALRHACETISAKDIRISRENLSGLMSLYNGLSDKESMAKKIIGKVLDEGRVKFQQVIKKSYRCESNVGYSTGDPNKVLSVQKLQDLRSQALFIASYNKISNTENEKEKMKTFVSIVEKIFNISRLIDDLQDLGHYEYGKLEKDISICKLNEYEKQLKDDKENWKISLRNQQEKCIWLNYVYGEQIQIIYGFLQDGRNKKEVSAVLKYINPDISMVTSKVGTNAISSKTSYGILQDIGKFLTSVLGELPPIRRSFEIQRTSSKLKDTIIKGRLLIVRIERDQSVLSRTILALYLNTTKHLPETHQLVICDHATKWNEVKLLLRRCIESGKMNRDSVFCIAGVECLNSEMKLRLANELKFVEGRTDSFRLGLIFKGDIHESFLQYFKDYVVGVDEIATLDDKEMDNCFQSHCKHVEVFTSDVAGLGKSENIARMALERKLELIRFHISGTFEKQDLLLDLLNLNSSKGTALHIDIGSMDEKYANMLDNFLFEIIILRVAKCGTLICPLTSDHIFIEIPNTLEETVKYNLPTLRHVKSTHLTQKLCLDRFVSSQDPQTPLQIVCRYLRSLEQNVLDTQDISESDALSISSTECIELIKTVMTTKPNSLKNNDLTYTNIKTFVDLLAYQLKLFSKSNFCKVENSRRMYIPKKGEQGIRSSLVNLLIERALEITSFAVKSGRNLQSKSLAAYRLLSSNISKEYDADEIPSWDNCIHALLLFNNDGHSITPLYRDISEVPDDIRTYFRNQNRAELPESIYHSGSNKKDLLSSQDELSTKLLRIVRSRFSRSVKELDRNYVLTPDNMLKMVLIYQRIKAKLPVVIVGETGCGKTSLIRYLADISNTNKTVFDIHAGLSKSDICSRIKLENEKAKKNLKSQFWLFLDEINTTEYIGILGSVICNRRLFTEFVAPNLTIIAACNPYRLRSMSNTYTEGLDSKVRGQYDKMSRLVYRVHPLPESMLCHVWDFGVVGRRDEKCYIIRMIEKTIETRPDKGNYLASNIDLIVDLITVSLETVREFEKEEFSVSLRDIDRCVRLVIFFIDYLQKKESQDHGSDPHSAIILSLAHCFLYRFRDIERRRRYLKNISEVFKNHNKQKDDSDIEKNILDEQNYLLSLMTIPDNTARNSALRENVFVLLVSILTKIPIFLVGQPGCSKSLSVQLIRKNLRGKNSGNDLLRQLPHVIFFSYQGSEASTSIGIQNVFDRAKRYQRKNNENDVRTVVLLDEVGLAEISPNNPLKVLHSLLEPDGRRTPDVAVIGISNWALDAAKMNRAIHLSRPKMTLEEITSTVSEIGAGNGDIPRVVIKAIASAYIRYEHDQRSRHFHGLRDIYALMKYLMSSNGTVEERLSHGLKRNFGGNSHDLKNVHTIFSEELAKHNLRLKQTKNLSVLDMIEENIMDKNSRHLMLICKGDVGISELKQILKKRNRPFEIMLGSSFSRDKSEEFDNNSLSRVILCMEKGKVLILKDFHSIYGSLYDMLNCNYMMITEKAKNDEDRTREKRYCRIAYGQYSNPMCVVHDHFKCVVIVNEDEASKIDPPFLNRFEKQALSIKDLANEEQILLATRVEKYLRQMQPKHEKDTLSNILTGYSSDSVLSLVLRMYKTLHHLKSDEIVKLCVKNLLPLMKPEGVIRFDESELYEIDREFVKSLTTRFNALPVNHGLSGLIGYVQENTNMMAEVCENMGHLNDLSLLRLSSSGLFVILTHCNIHRKYEIHGDVSSNIFKISDIESQQELIAILDEFYRLDGFSNIVFHLSYQEDAVHIDVVKNIAETFLYKSRKSVGSRRKFVFLLVHLQRPLNSILQVHTHVNFVSDWTFAYLDDLHEYRDTIYELCNMSLHNVISRREAELGFCIKKELPWSFTRIQYETGNERDIAGIQQCIENLSSPEMMRFLYNLVRMTIKPVPVSFDWIKLLSKDQKLMFEASTFRGAIERHVESKIVVPLAKVIYRLENLGALDALCSPTEMKLKQEYIQKSVLDEELLALDSLHHPSGPGCYIVRNYRKRNLPLSGEIFEKLRRISPEGDFQGTLDERRVRTFTSLARSVLDKVFHFRYEGLLDDYIYDYCESCTEQHTLSLDRTERHFVWLWISKNVFIHFIPSKSCSAYIENHLKMLSTLPSKRSSEVGIHNDDAYEIVSVLHLIGTNFKCETDSFLRLMTLANTNLFIDVVKFLQDHETSSVRVTETILRHICKQFVTDKDYLRRTSLAVWNSNALSLFSIAKSVLSSTDYVLSQNEDMATEENDEMTPISIDDIIELQVLRYCCDLVAMIMIPFNLPVHHLQHIAEILMNMSTCNTFSAVYEFLQDLSQKHNLPSHLVNVDQLLAYYVVRCLVLDENATEVFDIFLDFIECGKLKPTFWKSIMGALIEIKTGLLPENYLSQYLESTEDESILAVEVFMDCAVAKLKENSSAITTIGEILEDEFVSNISNVCFNERGMRNALSNIQNFENCTFKHLVSVAYLRVLTKLYVEQKVKNKVKMDTSTVVEILRSDKKTALYFWRLVRSHQTKDRADLPVNNLDEWKRFNIYDNPLALHCHVEPYRDIVLRWDQLCEFFSEENVDHSLILALCGIIHAKVYMKERIPGHCPSEKYLKEKDFAKLIVENASAGMNKHLQLFLKCVACVDSFRGICSTKTNVCIPSQLSSFIVQLGSVILCTFPQTSLWYKLISIPYVAFSSYMPGQRVPSYWETCCITCDCGCRSHAKLVDDRCPSCNGKLLCGCENESKVMSRSSKCQICKLYIRRPRVRDADCKTGFPLEKYANRRLEFYAVGNDVLPSISFRFVELLTFGCLSIADSIGHNVKSFNDEFTSEFLVQKLIQVWKSMCQLLSLTDFDLLQLLQTFVFKFKEDLKTVTKFSEELNVRQWEKSFSDSLMGFLGNRAKETSSLVQRHNQSYQLDQPCLFNEIDEKVACNSLKYDLFRVVAPSSPANMLCQLELQDHKRGKHKFLRLVLRYSPLLGLPRHLPVFVNWYKVSTNYCRYKMTRAQRKTLTVIKFIESHVERKYLHSEFNKIQECWNKLCAELKILKQLGFEVPELSSLGDATLIEECMVTADQSLLQTVIFYLASVQNDFLDRTLELDSDGTHLPTNLMKGKNGKSFLTQIPLSHVNENDVFSFDMNEMSHEFSQSLPYTGQGDIILYDFFKIEMEAMMELLEGKSCIQMPENLFQIEFKDDLFNNSASLLNDVRAKISQHSLDIDLENPLVRKLHEIPSLASELISAVGILLNWIRKSQENETVTVVEYLDKWKETHNLRSYRDIEPLTNRKLTLGNIVPLYLLMERVLGDRLLKSLSENLMVEQDSLQELQKLSTLARRNLANAVCVFAHRALSMENTDLNHEDCLADHLDNPSYWNLERLSITDHCDKSDTEHKTDEAVRSTAREVKAILQYVQRDIKIKHIKTVYLYIQEKQDDFLIRHIGTQGKNRTARKAKKFKHR